MAESEEEPEEDPEEESEEEPEEDPEEESKGEPEVESEGRPAEPVVDQEEEEEAEGGLEEEPSEDENGKNTNISDKDLPTMRETRSMQKRKNAKDKKETKVPKKIKHQSRKSPSKRKTPEKQQLQDSDSDFESSHPSKKAKKRSHQSKKTKKNNGKRILLNEKNRCSPEALLSLILGMSKEQKEYVRSMGFGALLKMKITDIPLKLGFYVLQKFDSERMVIDIEGKELKVTAESVHDMLGIPIGGTKLTQLDQWPKDDTKKIRYRETFEQEKGRFGVGELNEEFVNEQDEGDTYLEDSDSDKDEDHSVEAYESKISKMLNSFERMKEKLNSKLNDAMTKFPEKESFRIFKEKDDKYDC
ncbi:uncharacterized protein LOC122195461 [Lactuca sativa]|uniref:uncharacterized protein LOC122195461 n=1 Tax=Lactuca sativa TaxID=4236 RepID=UPI001C689068|nr:uncharacterized protein LOC122195461 [Lactuca sativa]